MNFHSTITLFNMYIIQLVSKHQHSNSQMNALILEDNHLTNLKLQIERIS